MNKHDTFRARMRLCRGAPYPHKVLLRQLGHECGAHMHLDSDDPVHAARELLVVNARRAGAKEFRRTCRVEVVLDLYAGDIVATDTDTWRTDLRKHERASNSPARRTLRPTSKRRCGARFAAFKR